MKLKSILIIIFLLATQAINSASAQVFRSWIALRVGSEIFTPMDIERHIEYTKLNLTTRQNLFKLAEQDYDLYLSMLKEISAPSYEATIKELAYTRMIEDFATKGLGRSQKRQAFTTTTEEFNRAISELESKAMKEWLDQRLGIVVARKEFGKKLRAENYPHDYNESDEEIYWRWFKEQQYRTTEQFRNREVAKFEGIMATRSNPSLHVRISDRHDLYDAQVNTIRNSLDKKELTVSEIQSIKKKNPHLNIVLKNLHLVSLSSLSLYRAHQLGAIASDKVLDMHRKINQEFAHKLSPAHTERLLQYEQSAQTLAARYDQANELEELSKDRLSKFVSKGDYTDFMMARLYDLAKIIKSEQPNHEQLRVEMKDKLNNALTWLKNQQKDPKFYQTSEVQSLLFEDAVARKLRNHLKVDDMQAGYEKSFLDMAIWTLKFEAKKIALNDKARVFTEIHPITHGTTYNGLDKILKHKEYMDGLNRFKQQELSRRQYLLEINPNGNQKLSSAEAWHWINS